MLNAYAGGALHLWGLNKAQTRNDHIRPGDITRALGGAGIGARKVRQVHNLSCLPARRSEPRLRCADRSGRNELPARARCCESQQDETTLLGRGGDPSTVYGPGYRPKPLPAFTSTVARATSSRSGHDHSDRVRYRVALVHFVWYFQIEQAREVDI